ARPIAMVDSLRFGDLSNPKVKHLAEGVVRGIADYGNCVGVPTVAGEVYSDPCYEGNPLVNAMCVGRIKTRNLTRAAARTVGAKGLTCSSCEMGSRGHVGIRIDLDLVPTRAKGLTPYEIMLSESQERMLAVCAAENLEQVREILSRWDLQAYVIGEVTEGGDL